MSWVIVGDDQEEVFVAGTLPPISVWCAPSATDDPPDPATMPAFRVASRWAYYSDHGPTTYPCRSDMATALVQYLSDHDFDVTTVASPPPGRHLGHAFTFVQRRLVRTAPMPMVPVMLNTFFPCSQPSVRRCIQLGTHLAHAIEAWPGGERVAVVASGGLSHHLIDEQFDRSLLASLGHPSQKAVLSLPPDAFTDGDQPRGTGESKNWIVTGAAARRRGWSSTLSTMSLCFALQPARESAPPSVGGAVLMVWNGRPGESFLRKSGHPPL